MLVMSLCSCSSNEKPPESESSYNLKYEFYTDKTYQYVYRLILNNADACSKQGLVSRMITEGQHYSDIKAGDINVSIHAPFGKYTHLRVKIETTDDKKTKIMVMNEFEPWDELAKVMQDWVLNETTLCR